MAFDITEFYKPNQLVAVIEGINMKSNRLAMHLCNYLLKFAQRELVFGGHSENDPWFEYSISEIHDLANIKTNNIKYIDEKVLDPLMRAVTIRPEDDPEIPDPEIPEIRKKLVKITPITSMIVDLQSGIYRFELSKTMIHLLKTKEFFTKLRLSDLNNIKSKYAYKICEYLIRYKGMGNSASLTVEKFRTLTNTTKLKTYDNFANVKDKILDPAMRDINENTRYYISYTLTSSKKRARGRPRIESIEFCFGLKVPLSKSASAIEKDMDIINISEIFSKEINIDNDYNALMILYTDKQNNFCSTPKDFFQATKKLPLITLQDFYSRKKNDERYTHIPNKINWLLSDAKSNQKLRRNEDQVTYYNELLDMFDKNERAIIKDNESKFGFASILYRMLLLQGIFDKIDLKKWL